MLDALSEMIMFIRSSLFLVDNCSFQTIYDSDSVVHDEGDTVAKCENDDLKSDERDPVLAPDLRTTEVTYFLDSLFYHVLDWSSS